MINVLVSTSVPLVGALIKSNALKKEASIQQMIISLTPLVLVVPIAYLWGLKGVVLARIGQNVTLSGYYYLFLKRLIR